VTRNSTRQRFNFFSRVGLRVAFHATANPTYLFSCEGAEGFCGYSLSPGGKWIHYTLNGETVKAVLDFVKMIPSSEAG
jgi:hypothetical protein